MAATEPVIGLLERVWTDLGALGDELDPADWDRPTDCPGWSVRDHYAHVIGTERMLAGEAVPSVAVGDADHLRNDIGRVNEAWIAERRGRPGPEVVAELRAVTAARLETLRGLSPAQWDEQGFTPEGPGPYRRFMQIRVFDCWFHEQDVREAVGRPGGLDGPVADHSLARVTDALGYIVGKRAGSPQGTTVVFVVTGAPEIVAAIGVEGRASRLAEVPADPTVRLTFDRRTFARLAGGRWDADRARAEGAVRVEGDAALGDQVVAAMGYTI